MPFQNVSFGCGGRDRIGASTEYAIEGMWAAFTVVSGVTTAVVALVENNQAAIQHIAYNRNNIIMDVARRQGEFLAAFYDTVSLQSKQRTVLTELLAAHQELVFSETDPQATLKQIVITGRP